jgi:hypothetical protein
VNRPYTNEELKEMYKKDHSIHEEDKKSRLQRCVSFNDPDYDNVMINEEKDTTKKASGSFIEKDDKPSTHIVDTTLSDDRVLSKTNSIFSTSP